MPKTLDRSRPFGEVWGSETGACYVQDDIEFDGQGEELTTEVRKTRGRKTVPTDDLSAADQLAAQLGIADVAS